MSPAQQSASQPDITPLDVDGVAASIVGTIVFFVAFVAMVPFRYNLDVTGRGYWVFVALSGTLIGVLLIAYTVRRRSVYRAAAKYQHEG